MKELLSSSLVFSIGLSLIGLFAIVACSETPTGEEKTVEDGVEIYEPILGKWAKPDGSLYWDIKKVSDNTGTLHWYYPDKGGYCENNYEYYFEIYIEWTMVDTSLPIKSIRYDQIQDVECGERSLAEPSSVKTGFEIRGDTLFSTSSSYFLRVEDY